MTDDKPKFFTVWAAYGGGDDRRAPDELRGWFSDKTTADLAADKQGWYGGPGDQGMNRCPFCGEAPRHLPNKAGFYTARVICDTCGFHLSPELWNRRALCAAGEAILEGEKAGDKQAHLVSSVPSWGRIGVAWTRERLAEIRAEVRASDECEHEHWWVLFARRIEAAHAPTLPPRRELPKVNASYASNSTYFRALGWNECLDEIARPPAPLGAGQLAASLDAPRSDGPDGVGSSLSRNGAKAACVECAHPLVCSGPSKCALAGLDSPLGRYVGPPLVAEDGWPKELKPATVRGLLKQLAEELGPAEHHSAVNALEPAALQSLSRDSLRLAVQIVMGSFDNAAAPGGTGGGESGQ
jgi:hypothetical protein